MGMDPTLSLNFSKERTQALLVSANAKGLQLDDVYLLADYFDVSMEGVEKSNSFSMLKAMLEPCRSRSTQLCAALPPEAMLIQHIPHVPISSHQDVYAMLNLEVMQNTPDRNVEDYAVEIYPLVQKLDGHALMVAVLTELRIASLLRKIASATGCISVSYQPRAFAAHAAFQYSYPELADRNIVLFGIYNDYIEASASCSSKLAYFHTNVMDYHSSTIGDICDNEIESILSTQCVQLDAAFFYGDTLTNDIVHSLRSRFQGLVKRVERIDSFRYCSTALDEDHRRYCSRLAHAFAPSLGACLPPVFHSISLHNDTAAKELVA